MSLAANHLAIESAFDTYWSTAGSTAVAYDNIKLDTDGLDEWVRLTVLPGDSRQVSAGAGMNVFRTFGVVIVQVFTRYGVGSKRAIELADAASNFFRGRVEGAVVFKAPAVAVSGADDGWYQINISSEFYSDELH